MNGRNYNMKGDKDKKFNPMVWWSDRRMVVRAEIPTR
jgi:hypothetical protein